jgi:hypothetical protein
MDEIPPPPPSSKQNEKFYSSLLSRRNIYQNKFRRVCCVYMEKVGRLILLIIHIFNVLL